MIIAPGTIHPLIGVIAILCISLGAGSAAAINMWYDRDIDAMMERTRMRPIVMGRVKADEALSCGIVLAFLSFVIMILCVNLCAACLLIFTILYYVFVYTIWLKRTSIHNVLIGGVSGAMPPMIGWAVVTNSIDTHSVLLSLIVLLWTPPHSWALALYRINDYTNCKVPMLPIIKGKRNTIYQILAYSVLMCVASSMPYFCGIVGMKYLILSSFLGIGFFYYAISLFKSQNTAKNARKLFIYSIFYLFMIFLGVLLLRS